MSEFAKYPFLHTENDAVHNCDVTHEDLACHPAFEKTLQSMRGCEIVCQREAWQILQPKFVNTVQSSLDAMVDANVSTCDVTKIVAEYALPRPSFQQCYVPLMNFAVDDIDPYDLLPHEPVNTEHLSFNESRSHFGGLPVLLEHETFPLCPTCCQPYRLVCQFHHEDIPATFLAAYAPPSVLSRITTDHSAMFQIFQCFTKPRCYRRSRQGDSTTHFDRSPNSSQGNCCERVRWISIPNTHSDDSTPDVDDKQNPLYYDKDYDYEPGQSVLGWHTFDDMPTVHEAATRYELQIPCDLFFMLDDFMSEPMSDPQHVWQLVDKFGGFGVFRNQDPFTRCTVCDHPMEIFLSFRYLACYIMPRKDDKFHLLICPSHKNLFYYLFD